MILDDEKHREMLLTLINSAQVPGRAIEDAYELKQAIINAECASAPEKQA